MIRYTVTPSDPRAHLFSVVCEVPAPDPDGQLFRMPAWIRGSYLVRDFAKHVVQVRASAAGAPVAIERSDKRSLRCAPVRGPLLLAYSVYAFDESVRKAWLDPQRGFFNGSSLFYAVAGQEQQACEVVVNRPPLPEGKDWRVATAMTPARVDGDGFGTYCSAGYEEAIDHPFELGAFEQLDFDVGGIPHAFTFSGRLDFDRARLAQDATRICHAQREMFGQEPKLDRYWFLTRVLGQGYGGLEHRSSSALVCARSDLPRPNAPMSREYRGFLSLVSHEYFHLWNVKRMVPQRLAESDLGAEAYTADLWHYEGVTSYYDDLMLLRAGVVDAAGYLDLLAETATRLERNPGRKVQTLADASLEAWTKHYQPDEHTPNATVSYYVKGALAALCLDLYLRRHGTTTLDEVMRALWEEFGRHGRPVPEGGLERVAGRVSGLALQPEFDRWLRSTDELPLAGLLEAFGVRAERRASTGDSDAGGRTTGRPAGATLGLRLRGGDTTVLNVYTGGPAQRAGLTGGDVLVALDGIRVAPGRFSQRVADLAPGRSYAMHYFRGDELFETSVVADVASADTWTFTLADVDGETLQRRQAWLGS